METKFNPKRLLICGDFHGDLNHGGYIYQMAHNKGAEAIVQVGDFGIWPKHTEGYLFWCAKMYVKFGIPMYFIDGNHEWFDWLKDEGYFGADTIQEIQPGLSYLPRGVRWEWNGKSFLAFGGAHSIDKAYRREGLSWWPEELPTYGEVDKVLADLEENPGVDIMITHDSPRWPGGLESGYKQDATSEYCRNAIRAIVDEAKPDVLYHGHYHHSWRGTYKGTTIFGLDRDGTKEKSWKVVDL